MLISHFLQIFCFFPREISKNRDFFLEGHIPPINLNMNLKSVPNAFIQQELSIDRSNFEIGQLIFEIQKKIEIQKIFMVIGMIIFYLSYFLKLFCKIFGYFDEFDVFL